MKQSKAFDILIYMSDQHAADVAGFMGDTMVRTPNLDRIAAKSTVFTNAYTSCPLCVPARASFMTGRMPSQIGVFGNDDAYGSQNPTFVHSLGINGYETVLCGRMHFIGGDQRHGFEKRIAGDICPSLWGDNFSKRDDMGDYRNTFAQKTCLQVIGPGDSPVLAYDRYVAETALDYLSQNHDRPQMMVVGTYGPHFPYAADEEKMEYYRKVLAGTCREEQIGEGSEAVREKMQYPEEPDLLEVRAAYYAMVETMDEQVGQVYDAFLDYVSQSGRPGIFIYLSDHGDQIGYKHLFGKQTFYEYSAKIPMMIQIEGTEAKRYEDPVSIMDLGSTLCGLTGSPIPPLWEGEDLSAGVRGEAPLKRGKPVVSEFFDRGGGLQRMGLMIREGDFKYISYEGDVIEELLFCMEKDPEERTNLAGKEPIAGHFRQLAKAESARRKPSWQLWKEQKTNSQFLKQWGSCYPELDSEMWLPPADSVHVRPENKRPRYY